MKPFMNAIFDAVTLCLKVFEPIIELTAKTLLNSLRLAMPNHIELPGTPFSLSLSFPDVPKLLADITVFPVDGTIYLTEVGYNPKERQVSPTPYVDDSNNNNIQIFLNEYVLNTLF